MDLVNSEVSAVVSCSKTSMLMTLIWLKSVIKDVKSALHFCSL